MSELSIVLVNLIAIATAYFFIYPKYASDDVMRLAWLDTAVGATVLVVLAPFNWNTPNDYTLFVVDLNWWMFAFITYFLLELPLFYFYSKARGLGSAYREMWGLNSGFTTIASEKSVKKQLSDTKWDGLRTRGALRFLVLGSNLTVLLGTTFLVFVGDNEWAALIMLYVLFLMIFWALLRRAVRLITEAPDDALDERMIQERNSVYYRAYQYLFGVSSVLVAALLGYSVATDLLDDGDVFNYEINLTWPQINAIFWLIFGYAYMLPSMIMAWREANRMEQSEMTNKNQTNS
jgi:hypothetical protein